MSLLLGIALIITGIVLLVYQPPRSVSASNNKMLGLAAIVFGAGMIIYNTIAVIPAGHVGVIDIFGHVSQRTLKPGINFVNPLAHVIRMSIKTQELKEVSNVPSQEGLTVNLEVSVLYHLDPEKAADVYKTVGPVYQEILLIPQFRSVIRTVTSSYDAKALYTSLREKLASSIKNDLEAIVAQRGLIIENTPLRNITLPQRVAEAIEEKLSAEQESQRMQFVLQKEKLEAERKRIEAQGITDYQRIVSQGLSELLLRWKGIEATEKLASSSNSKIVVIGGKDGMPLILNAEK
ncbi:MAG: prohibitin family protein [Chitinispirillaceae bacterium]|nr:prohibitin family protein [Chitinispirillaceae bacterium]